MKNLNKTIAIIALLMITSMSINAQKDKRILTVKGFLNYDKIVSTGANKNQMLTSVDGEDFENTTPTYSKMAIYFSPSLSIQSLYNDNFHEVEIEKVDFVKNNRVYAAKDVENSQRIVQTEVIDVRLNYEYNIRCFEELKKVKVFMGFGFAPVFLKEKYQELATSDLPISKSMTGFNFNAIPRIRYNIQNKVGIELKTQIDLYSLGITTVRHNANVFNPKPINVESKTYTRNNAKSLFSLGLTYTL